MRDFNDLVTLAMIPEETQKIFWQLMSLQFSMADDILIVRPSLNAVRTTMQQLVEAGFQADSKQFIVKGNNHTQIYFTWPDSLKNDLRGRLKGRRFKEIKFE